MNAAMTEIIANQALINVSLLGIVYQNFPDCFDKKKKKNTYLSDTMDFTFIFEIYAVRHIKNTFFFYRFFHCSIVFRKIWKLSIFLHAWWMFSISWNIFPSSSALEICENCIEKHRAIMNNGPRSCYMHYRQCIFGGHLQMWLILSNVSNNVKWFSCILEH